MVRHPEKPDDAEVGCFFAVLPDLVSEFAIIDLESKTFDLSMVGFVGRRCSLLELLMITIVGMLRFGTTFRSTTGGITGGAGKAKMLFVVITMKNRPRK